MPGLPETSTVNPKRLRHRWSSPDRTNPECTIRVCLNPNCKLTWHSNHDYSEVAHGGDRGHHWAEYYTDENPDVRLTVLPECVEVKSAP